MDEDEKGKMPETSTTTTPAQSPQLIPTFILSHDLSRGAMFALQALMSYVLMLAVMYVVRPLHGRIEPYSCPGRLTPPISSLSWLVWELGRLYSGDGKELARMPRYIDLLALLLYFCTCTVWMEHWTKTSLLQRQSREIQVKTRAAPP